jgi:hypothetical protein
MHADDRETQAQLVLVLNQLQETNERCRGYLVDGNLHALVAAGRKLSDLAVLLMLTAGHDDNTDPAPFDDVLFDPRARAAGEHLDRR